MIRNCSNILYKNDIIINHYNDINEFKEIKKERKRGGQKDIDKKLVSKLDVI